MFNSTNNNRDRYLTEYAFEYGSKREDFIFDKICAVSEVAKSEGRYPVMLPEDSMRPVDEKLMVDDGVSAPPVIQTWNSEDTYSCEPKHLKAPVTLLEQQEWQIRNGVEPFKKSTRDLMKKWLHYMEGATATLFRTPASYAAGHSVTLGAGVVWTDPVNGVPVDNIDAGITKIVDDTGMFPNTMWMSWKVYQALRRHPQITEVTKYTGAGWPTGAQIAAYFGVKNVAIGKATRVTSAQGISPVVKGSYFDDEFGLCYVPERLSDDMLNSDQDEAASARWFVHVTPYVEKMRATENTGTNVIIRWSADLKVTGLDSVSSGLINLGYLIDNAI